MTIVIAAAVWAAVLGLVVIRGHGAADRSTIYAALAIGVGVALNITPLYVLVDGWLGHRNLGDLIANASIILGVSSIARGVVTAADGTLPFVRIILWRWMAWIAISLSVLAFSMIDMHGTSAQFMIDYGDQLAAAVYSGVQHTYFGLVTASLAVICARQIARTGGLVRFSAGVMMTGGVVQAFSCANVLFMNTVHVLGNERLLSVGQWVYDIANSAGYVLLSAGFVLLPAARFFSERRLRGRAGSLARELEPAWRRALDTRRSGPRADTPDEIESILYRQAVVVRDAQAGARGEFHLSAREEALLEEAESLLLGAGSYRA